MFVSILCFYSTPGCVWGSLLRLIIQILIRPGFGEVWGAGGMLREIGELSNSRGYFSNGTMEIVQCSTTGELFILN